jgi:peptidoglycan/LPS O-acetylase OafA/YrhL
MNALESSLRVRRRPSVAVRHRLHSLDALRGIAALAVVFWHWQHLQVLGGARLTWPPAVWPVYASEPFYAVLRPVYDYGFCAVDLFFILSGFVFYWLYRRAIEARSVTLREFSVARFSRLYPLHLVTLVAVGFMQLSFHALSGQFFVYPANDAVHLLQSLFFIQRSGSNAAFNGPEWSLFVELIMYAVFFVAARFGLLRRNAGALIGFALGILLWHFDTKASLARGLSGFFMGGITFSAYSLILRKSNARTVLYCLAGAMLAGWAALLIDRYTDGLVRQSLGSLGLFSNDKVVIFAILYGLFPVSILTFALFETLWNVSFTRLAWLGEASYSSYLLHFPLQLALAIAVYLNIISLAGSRSAICLVAYFAVLIPLSLFVFRRFERPMQAMIRRMVFGVPRTIAVLPLEPV